MRVFNERSGFCEDEILYRKRWIEITKLIMSAQFCAKQLDEQEKLVRFQKDFMLTLCVINFVFSVVAALGNF